LNGWHRETRAWDPTFLQYLWNFSLGFFPPAKIEKSSFQVYFLCPPAIALSSKSPRTRKFYLPTLQFPLFSFLPVISFLPLPRSAGCRYLFIAQGVSLNLGSGVLSPPSSGGFGPDQGVNNKLAGGRPFHSSLTSPFIPPPLFFAQRVETVTVSFEAFLFICVLIFFTGSDFTNTRDFSWEGCCTVGILCQHSPQLTIFFVILTETPSALGLATALSKTRTSSMYVFKPPFPLKRPSFPLGVGLSPKCEAITTWCPAED